MKPTVNSSKFYLSSKSKINLLPSKIFAPFGYDKFIRETFLQSTVITDCYYVFIFIERCDQNAYLICIFLAAQENTFCLNDTLYITYVNCIL